MINLNQTKEEKEKAIELMRSSIPPDMLEYKNFVCFKLEPDEKSHSGYSKKPKNPRTGGNASSTNPMTWGSFDEAARAWLNTSGALHGIGFMFGGSPFFGVDIDDIGDQLSSGDFTGADMVQALHTYTEISPSGTGLHCICAGELPPEGRKNNKTKIEMYSEGRFFTLTGNVYANPRTVCDCTETIKPYHAKYIKPEGKKDKNPPALPSGAAAADLTESAIIYKATIAANGSTFKALFFDGNTSGYNGDDSAADMALCNLLAFWTGKDAGMIDTLFRKSALYRPKWDELRGAQTYGQITIGKAINSCDKCYDMNYNNLQDTKPAHFKPQALEWDGTPEEEQPLAGAEPSAEPPALDDLTADDFINGTAVYEYIGAFYSENGIDEIALQDYIQQARARAVKFKCGKAFDGKMKARVLTLKKDDKERRRQKAAERAAKAAAKLPDWVIPTEHGNQIEENIFCQEYLNRNGEMKCITGFFYNVDGLVDMGKIVHDVYDKIQFYIFKDVAQRARKIVDCLSLYTYSAPIAPDLDRIHVNNGTLIINGAGFTFEPQKYFCTNRLKVDYVDSIRRPDKWRAFLDNLLDHTDQLTLQEYFGYCLLPTTKAQTALFIIGKGGEGKSVVGAVLKAIFGDTLTAGAVEDLDNGSKARFARVKLVSKLVMLDDDVELAALEKTAFLKQLITARVPSEIEPKGKPSFEALLYARIVAFGNGAISSLYDTSDGFFRRQLILSAKPKDPTRTDDPNIIESILTEKEKIFVWALQGLERLIKNNYKFTVSEQTRQNVEVAKRDSNNIIKFMDSGRVVIDHNTARSITVRELYDIYQDWCYESAEKARTPYTFTRFLHDNEKKYGIKYSENVHKADGKRARGFIGIGNIHAYTL